MFEIYKKSTGEKLNYDNIFFNKDLTHVIEKTRDVAGNTHFLEHKIEDADVEVRLKLEEGGRDLINFYNQILEFNHIPRKERPHLDGIIFLREDEDCEDI